MSLGSCFLKRQIRTKRPNGPMHLTPMPSALFARRLRSSLWRQKQVVIRHRGRSAKKYDSLFLDTNITH